MSSIVVEHYEFTTASKGTLLSFELPEPLFSTRPKGLASQPWAAWDPLAHTLTLSYPNLPRAIHLLFKAPPQALCLILEQGESVLVCQTRFGQILRAHFFRAFRDPHSKVSSKDDSLSSTLSSSSASETPTQQEFNSNTSSQIRLDPSCDENTMALTLPFMAPLQSNSLSHGSTLVDHDLFLMR